MTMTVDQVLGRKVKAARETMGMSQAELGKALEDFLGKPWPRQTVSNAEKGDRPWRAVELIALQEILRVTWWNIEENVVFPSGATARIDDIDFGDLTLDIVDELGQETIEAKFVLDDLMDALLRVRKAMDREDDPGVGESVEILVDTKQGIALIPTEEEAHG